MLSKKFSSCLFVVKHGSRIHSSKMKKTRNFKSHDIYGELMFKQNFLTKERGSLFVNERAAGYVIERALVKAKLKSYRMRSIICRSQSSRHCKSVRIIKAVSHLSALGLRGSLHRQLFITSALISRKAPSPDCYRFRRASRFRLPAPF